LCEDTRPTIPFLIATDQLIARNRSFPILIQLLENTFLLLKVFRLHTLLRDKSQHRFLHFELSRKVFQISKHTRLTDRLIVASRRGFRVVLLRLLDYPRVVQCLLCGQAVFRVHF
jgi:hypothetical protein